MPSPERLVTRSPRERGVEDGDRDQEHPEAGGEHQHHVEAVHAQPGHQQPPSATHTAQQLKYVNSLKGGTRLGIQQCQAQGLMVCCS